MEKVSVKEQITRLIELQKIDREIYRLNREKEEKPILIDNLKKEFEEKKAKAGELENQKKDLEKKRKEKELELASKEENIKKLNNQLFSIKTNKEYQAMQREIEGLKTDSSLIEEEIIKIFDAMDELKNSVDKFKTQLQEEEQKFNSEKKRIEDELKEIEENLKLQEAKRKQFAPQIEKKILKLYERILLKWNGLAIVPVKSDCCGGCFLNMPPQVLNEIKMYDKIITCEMCNRILYIEEDIQVG